MWISPIPTARQSRPLHFSGCEARHFQAPWLCVFRRKPSTPEPDQSFKAKRPKARLRFQSGFELVDLTLDSSRQPVAEFGEILANQRHLGSPAVEVDGQQLRDRC